jgi:dolichyl-phosphate beta-glucosyltransferase
LQCTLVVPCYNEAKRLDLRTFEVFFPLHENIQWIFVNDGSTDSTLVMLEDLADRYPGKVRVVNQQPNQGKAEAVRQGLLEAYANGNSELVGFWDADLATPLDTIPEMIEILEQNLRIEMVFGSRVKLLGRQIHRQAIRHYLGRVFATTVSTLLGLPIYDTQCGAKIFRSSRELAAVLSERFISRWVFDVEILARLMKNRDFNVPLMESVIYELPLRKWQDVGGSKIKPTDFFKALFEVWVIWWTYLRR